MPGRPDHGTAALGVAREAVDAVERDLAEFQKDEAMIWRLGAVALMIGALLLGAITSGVVLAFVARWWARTRPGLDATASAVPSTGSG